MNVRQTLICSSSSGKQNYRSPLSPRQRIIMVLFPNKSKKTIEESSIVPRPGTLDEKELIPVAESALSAVISFQDDVSNTFECRVTELECKRFLDIFDRDKNGFLDRDEFMNFMKFAVCRKYIEIQYREEQAAEQEELMVEAGEIELHDHLARLEESVDYADDMIRELPGDLGRGLFFLKMFPQFGQFVVNLAIRFGGVVRG